MTSSTTSSPGISQRGRRPYRSGRASCNATATAIAAATGNRFSGLVARSHAGTWMSPCSILVSRFRKPGQPMLAHARRLTLRTGLRHLHSVGRPDGEVRDLRARQVTCFNMVACCQSGVSDRESPTAGAWAGVGDRWSGGFGFDDDGLAVADRDPLAGDRLQLAGQGAGSAFFVDA